MTAAGGFDPDQALRVITAVLRQPGGGETVLGALGVVPGVVYQEAMPGRFLRSARPSRLVVDDYAFVATVGDDRLQVSHVVRGVALQTERQSAVEAARAVVDALQRLIDERGTATRDGADVALYGLAVMVGLG